MTTVCETIKGALASFDRCEDTVQGARIETHCLYPSFDRVAVYIVKMGEGYLVHDGGEAHSCAWAHGRDDGVAVKALAHQAGRFGLAVENRQLVVRVQSADWLTSAILSVSNAASNAATEAVAKQSKASAERLHERVREALVHAFTASRVEEKVYRVGDSGREYAFDFSVREGSRAVIIDVVTPARGSIVHKYTAFADSKVRRLGGAFAVHDLPLVPADTNLLSQVADVVPYLSLPKGVERALLH
jgi:hypothetical protein